MRAQPRKRRTAELSGCSSPQRPRTTTKTLLLILLTAFLSPTLVSGDNPLQRFFMMMKNNKKNEPAELPGSASSMNMAEIDANTDNGTGKDNKAAAQSLPESTSSTAAANAASAIPRGGGGSSVTATAVEDEDDVADNDADATTTATKTSDGNGHEDDDNDKENSSRRATHSIVSSDDTTSLVLSLEAQLSTLHQKHEQLVQERKDLIQELMETKQKATLDLKSAQNQAQQQLEQQRVALEQQIKDDKATHQHQLAAVQAQSLSQVQAATTKAQAACQVQIQDALQKVEQQQDNDDNSNNNTDATKTTTSTTTATATVACQVIQDENDALHKQVVASQLLTQQVEDKFQQYYDSLETKLWQQVDEKVAAQAETICQERLATLQSKLDQEQTVAVAACHAKALQNLTATQKTLDEQCTSAQLAIHEQWAANATILTQEREALLNNLTQHQAQNADVVKTLNQTIRDLQHGTIPQMQKEHERALVEKEEGVRVEMEQQHKKIVKELQSKHEADTANHLQAVEHEQMRHKETQVTLDETEGHRRSLLQRSDHLAAKLSAVQEDLNYWQTAYGERTWFNGTLLTLQATMVWDDTTIAATNVWDEQVETTRAWWNQRVESQKWYRNTIVTVHPYVQQCKQIYQSTLRPKLIQPLQRHWQKFQQDYCRPALRSCQDKWDQAFWKPIVKQTNGILRRVKLDIQAECPRWQAALTEDDGHGGKLNQSKNNNSNKSVKSPTASLTWKQQYILPTVDALCHDPIAYLRQALTWTAVVLAVVFRHTLWQWLCWTVMFVVRGIVGLVVLVLQALWWISPLRWLFVVLPRWLLGGSASKDAPASNTDASPANGKTLDTIPEEAHSHAGVK